MIGETFGWLGEALLAVECAKRTGLPAMVTAGFEGDEDRRALNRVPPLSRIDQGFPLGVGSAGTSPLGEALGRLLVGGVVDAVLTPQRLADLLRLAGPDGDVRDPEQMKRQVRYAFLTGPFDFRVSLGEPGSRAESWTHADFRFQGDAWRLVALRLPAA